MNKKHIHKWEKVVIKMGEEVLAKYAQCGGHCGEIRNNIFAELLEACKEALSLLHKNITLDDISRKYDAEVIDCQVTLELAIKKAEGE